MEYLMLFGYILPMIVNLVITMVCKDDIEDLYLDIIMSIIPVINVTFILFTLSSDNHECDKMRKTMKSKLTQKLPNCSLSSLTPQAKIDIKEANNELKNAINKLKQDHANKVKEIKKKDEKKKLLDKLGLTEDDLKKLKDLK